MCSSDLAFDVIRVAADPHRTLVRGRRLGRPMFDRVFTAGMGLMASLLLGGRLHDINAQPKVFHRSLLDAMHDAPHDFSLDLYLLHLANRKGLDVREIPVRFGARQRGDAKGGGSLAGKVRLTRRTVDYMLTLRRSLRAGMDWEIREEATP